MDNDISTASSSSLPSSPYNAPARQDPKAFILMLSLVIMALTAITVLATQLGWPNL